MSCIENTVSEKLDKNNDDPNHNYQILEESLIDSNNECFHIRVVKFNRKRHKISPWMTNGILKSKNYRLYNNHKQFKSNLFMSSGCLQHVSISSSSHHKLHNNMSVDNGSGSLMWPGID